MAQMTISGVDDSVKQGYIELSKKYNISMAQAARPALGSWLQERADELPEYLEKDVKFEKLTDENRWKMRVMWFESNVREWFNDALERDCSPDPERVEWAFVESCEKEIIEQAPDKWEGELRDHLEQEFARYKVHYDAEGTGVKDRGEVVDYAARHVKHGRTDLAIEYAESMAKNGRLPSNMGPQQVVDEARDVVNKENMDGLPIDSDSTPAGYAND